MSLLYDDKPPRKGPSRGAIISVGIVLGLVLLSQLGSGRSTPSTAVLSVVTTQATTATTLALSVEAQLAVIDRGAAAATDQAVHSPYRSVLDSLEVKCSMTRRRISDSAVGATLLLKEDFGLQMSALEMLRAADGAIPTGGGVDCVEVFAVLIVLIGNE